MNFPFRKKVEVAVPAAPTEVTKPDPKPDSRLAKATLIGTVVVGLVGHGVTLSAAYIGQEGKKDSATVVSCPEELDKALELRKKNPTVDITYTGDLETQCHLNSAVRQVPVPLPQPTQ